MVMEWEWFWKIVGLFGGLFAVAFGLVKVIYSGLEKKIDLMDDKINHLSDGFGAVPTVKEDVAELKGQMRGLSDNYNATRDRIHELSTRLAGDYVPRAENDRKFSEMNTKIDRLEIKIDRVLERMT